MRRYATAAKACNRAKVGQSSEAFINRSLQSPLSCRVLFISDSGSHCIGPINLDTKCAGARSAGNPHATCDVAGVGNEITELPNRARRWKPRIQPRKFLRICAPALDPTNRFAEASNLNRPRKKNKFSRRVWFYTSRGCHGGVCLPRSAALRRSRCHAAAYPWLFCLARSASYRCQRRTACGDGMASGTYFG